MPRVPLFMRATLDLLFPSLFVYKKQKRKRIVGVNLSNHPEDEQQRSVIVEKAKDVTKKKVKKVARKALKKVAKAAMKAAAKAVAATVKALLAFLGTALAPIILGAIAVLLLIVIIYAASTLLFSGADKDTLNADAYELQQYVFEYVKTSINYDKPQEREYMLPPELIIAIMQLFESEKSDMTPKQAVKYLVDKLKPVIEYETIDQYTESYATTCVDGVCSDSAITKTSYKTDVISYVETWNGTLSVDMKEVTGPWEHGTVSSTTTPVKDKDGNVVGSSTTTVQYHGRAHTVTTNENWQESYTYFEKILSGDPFNYNPMDLALIESLYQLTGGEMNYTAMKMGYQGGFGSGDYGDLNVVPGSNVPAEYMQYYLAAQKRFGVNWEYVAAIHYVETKFSTHKPMISSAGAEGPTQFMPCTWVGWSYPGCKGSNGYVNIPDSIKYNPAVIKKYGGYGVDADGDGIASTFSLADATMTTAYYLQKNGFKDSPSRAIGKYNHSQIYIDNVLAKAKEIREAAKYTPNSQDAVVTNPTSYGFVAPTKGRITSSWGGRDLQGSADFHAALDIANKPGTPVVSIGNGTVTRVSKGCNQNGYVGNKCGGGWGNYIRITYKVKGTTYEAIYAHLLTSNVAAGQTVSAGQVIASMGNSGSSTGPHLHIEMHIPYRPSGSIKNAINPIYYLPPIPSG